MSKEKQKENRGFVITIDYGHLAEDLYSEQRYRGTLMCYLSTLQVRIRMKELVVRI